MQIGQHDSKSPIYIMTENSLRSSKESYLKRKWTIPKMCLGQFLNQCILRVVKHVVKKDNKDGSSAKHALKMIILIDAYGHENGQHNLPNIKDCQGDTRAM